MHRVVGVVARVVVRARRDGGAVNERFIAWRDGVHDAAAERAVQMEAQPEIEVRIRQLQDRINQARNHVARKAHLLVTGRRHEILLAAFLADEHVRSEDVRAARKIEADERNLASAVGGDLAGALQQSRKIGRQCRCRFPRVREQAQYARTRNRCRAGHEALGNELASRDRTRMVCMKLRLIPVPYISSFSHSLNPFLVLSFTESISMRCRAWQHRHPSRSPGYRSRPPAGDRPGCPGGHRQPGTMRVPRRRRRGLAGCQDRYP